MAYRRILLFSLGLFGLLGARSLAVEPQTPARVAARLDELFAAHWKAKKVTPTALSDDAEFHRRVWLDIAGRIPPIDEVRDFLDDPAANKRVQLIDRLVQRNLFASHWGRVWRNVLVPPGQNDPFRQNFGPSAEAWFRTQLQNRAPYDQMVRSLLLPEQARGNGRLFDAINQNKPENLAAAASRLFLGVKIECAQCHDHPFAKWKRQQFWEFAAFFAPNNARQITIPSTGKTAEARFLDGKAPPDGDGRTVLVDWLASAENPYFARAAVNRVWEYLCGTGFVEPIEEFHEENPPHCADMLDELSAQFVAHKFDLSFLVRTILLTRVYQFTSKQSHDSQTERTVFARMPLRGLMADQVLDNLGQVLGHPVPDSRTDPTGFFTQRSEFLALFASTEKRTDAQTTILQALSLMNGQVVTDLTSLKPGHNIQAIAEANEPTSRKIDELYMMTLSRRPSAPERDRLVKYVDQGGSGGNPKQALTDVFWALLNSTEFAVNH
jgi:hypothetical protein